MFLPCISNKSFVNIKAVDFGAAPSEVRDEAPMSALQDQSFSAVEK